MQTINREWKNFKKEAEVELELLSAMGYDVEDVYLITQNMLKIIEPNVMRVREKKERLASIK